MRLIFVDYSEKMWGVPFAALPDAIRNRVPLRRTEWDTRYFTDRYQGQPKQGFSAMFARRLEGIPVHTGVEEQAWRKAAKKADLHSRPSPVWRNLLNHLLIGKSLSY